jgi:hypothetical protein
MLFTVLESSVNSIPSYKNGLKMSVDAELGRTVDRKTFPVPRSGVLHQRSTTAGISPSDGIRERGWLGNGFLRRMVGVDELNSPSKRRGGVGRGGARG